MHETSRRPFRDNSSSLGSLENASWLFLFKAEVKKLVQLKHIKKFCFLVCLPFISALNVLSCFSRRGGSIVLYKKEEKGVGEGVFFFKYQIS